MNNSTSKEKSVGKPFWELYNHVAIKPEEQWSEIYHKMKEEASDWGLQLK